MGLDSHECRSFTAQTRDRRQPGRAWTSWALWPELRSASCQGRPRASIVRRRRDHVATPRTGQVRRPIPAMDYNECREAVFSIRDDHGTLLVPEEMGCESDANPTITRLFRPRAIRHDHRSDIRHSHFIFRSLSPGPTS